MIGRLGFTEDLAERNVRTVPYCEQKYQQEMAKIKYLEDLDPEDTSGANYSFSTMQRDDSLQERRDEAKRIRDACFRAAVQARDWNKRADAEAKRKHIERLDAAQSRLALAQGSTQKGGGLGFWLLPLLALIPLGFIVLRRKK